MAGLNILTGFFAIVLIHVISSHISHKVPINAYYAFSMDRQKLIVQTSNHVLYVSNVSRLARPNFSRKIRHKLLSTYTQVIFCEVLTYLWWNGEEVQHTFKIKVKYDVIA